MALLTQKCVPCLMGTPPLTRTQISTYLPELKEDWQVINDVMLKRKMSFEDFSSALAYVNQLGELAETEGHHPDIEIGWGYVIIKLYTHKINGLSEADFIFAAKSELL